MKIRPSRHSRGFTLMEIMLALFILGVIIAAIFASWSAIVRGTKVGLDATAAAQRSRTAVRTIESAMTSARSFASDLEQYGFVAENGGTPILSFVARLPASFPRSGRFGDFDVRRVTFSLEQGAGYSRELVLRQQPLLMEMDEDEREHPIVLARNVRAFEMEFWDRTAGDWADEWSQTNHLPQMVKITLQFAGNESQSRIREEITKVISVPAVTVPPQWQTPGQAR
jgi:type II secretion system protein J